MAEDTESKKPNTFDKGLNLDLAPENQPEGTYRFALNGVLESNEGDFYSMNNEPANYDCLNLPEDFVPIGSIYSSDDERLIFLCSKDEQTGAIVLVKKCNIEILVQDNRLGFRLNKPIKGVYRLRNGCERNYYFIDGHNPDRVINIDRLDIYKDLAGDWVIKEFDLIRSIKEPKITFESVKEGGGKTSVGTFQLAARYLDEYNNPMPFSKLTFPTRVVPDSYPISGPALAVHGGMLSDNPLTNKSFTFSIQDLDENYPFLEIAALVTTNGVNRAYVVDKINVQPDNVGNNTFNYTYTGTETNYSTEVPLTELTVATSREITSQAIVQADNRLVRLNTSEPYYDWIPFVKAALETETGYYIDAQDWDESKKPTGGTSFMGDEVYAFGVQWVIDDKIESPVFHIPGRDIIINAGLSSDGNANVHNRKPSNATLWDTTPITVVADSVSASTSEVNIREVEFLNEYSPTPKITVGSVLNRFEIFNTAIATGLVTYDNISIPPPITELGGILSYWESEERYPLIKDCVHPYGYLYPTEVGDGGKIIGKRIRHHKMPDRTLETVVNNSSRDLTFGIVNNIKPFFKIKVPNVALYKQLQADGRLKFRIVSVPRDRKNSTVVDAGIIALAPYINEERGKNTRYSEMTDPSVYWQLFVGQPSDPGPKDGYNAVTTNFNCLMSNIPDRSGNLNYPCDWYYTHFISPTFTHGEGPFDYSYYKLERVMWGPSYMECRKNVSNARSHIDYFNPEYIASLFLIDSSVPGDNTPDLGGVVQSPAEEGTPLAFEKKIGAFANWYHRVVNYGEQIDFNSNRIIQNSVNSIEYTTRTGNAKPVSMPNSLKRFGTLIGHKYQKGFICNLKDNQWIPDHLNSNNVAAGFTSFTGTNPTLSSFFASAESTRGKATNAYNYLNFVGGAAIFESSGFSSTTIGATGDTAYGHQAYYGIMKNNVRSPYLGLDNLTYRAVTDLRDVPVEGSVFTIPAQNGDCSISRFDYTNTYDGRVNPNGKGIWWTDPMHRRTATGDDDYEPVRSKIANDIKFMVESPLNINLASSDLDNSKTFAPYSLYGNSINLVQWRDEYHHGSNYDENNNEVVQLASKSWNEIYYRYNKDFSKLNIDNLYFPLPHTFDYCRECINSNSNRIYASEKSFVEELRDMYRTFLVNNYKDINGEFGEIVDAFILKNQLIVDTEEARYVQRFSEQKIETDESTISIGTGDFLSQEADRISDSTIGFMGNQSRYAGLVIENGLFSLDSRAGTIFMLTEEGPKPISRLGLSQWFRENLPSKLKAQLEELTEETFNYKVFDNPHNIYNPTGFISAIDTKYDRIILTKHDWELIDFLDEENELNSGGVQFFNAGVLQFINGKWVIGEDFIEPKNYPKLFENKSWTLSFSIKDNCWASWHSYMPTFMYGNKLEFVSYNSDQDKLYKHNKFGSYQTFYGDYYPHIIETVQPSKSMTSEIYQHLQYNSIAKQWDSTTKEYVDKRFVTFDKGIFYNSYQNSGLLNLIPKKKADYWARQFEQRSGEVFIDVNEKLYTINGFKNMNFDIDKSLFTRSWTALQNQYFIDKVINNSAIDLNKFWYKRDVFRDRYLISRLFFSIFANTRISTMMSSFKTTNSIR